MDVSNTQALILNTLTVFGNAVLVIITSVIGIGLAYLIYRYGWTWVKNALNGGVDYADYMAEENRRSMLDAEFLASRKKKS